MPSDPLRSELERWYCATESKKAFLPPLTKAALDKSRIEIPDLVPWATYLSCECKLAKTELALAHATDAGRMWKLIALIGWCLAAFLVGYIAGVLV